MIGASLLPLKEQSGTEPETYPYHIAIIGENTDDSFWNLLYRGVNKAAGEYGAIAEETGAGLSQRVTTEDAIKMAIYEDADGILLLPGSDEALEPLIDQAEDAGIPVEFKDGQRVTTEEGMDIVRTILAGKVNQELVRALNEHGNIAVGVNGVDGGTVIAEPVSEELGRVGNIKRINGAFLQDLIDADYIPVIASIAIGNDGGYCNVNADVMAGQIAAATGAAKILFLTDVDGLYLDFDDKDTLVSQLSLEEARDLIDSGTLSSGMIPKLRSCVAALEGGVPSAYIVNGTIPHAILLEMLTLSGVGTAVYADSEDATNASRGPIGNFASKLLENK